MRNSVSVVIPAHNEADNIVRAVNSVTHQTHAVLEIIVVDDASTDETRNVVEALAINSMIPIRILSLSTNKGPGLARNIGWDNAQGDLVAFLDADDVWHPQKIEIQTSLMALYPDIVMSAHDRTVGETSDWKPIVLGRVMWRKFHFRDFLVKNRCATPSVVVRRDIRERFNPELRHAEDYHLWLRITHKYGPVHFTTENLVNCANPSYGGHGLSGDLIAMYLGEINVIRSLARTRQISKPLLPLMLGWSTIKFLVRVVDHRFFGDRLQTVSESR